MKWRGEACFRIALGGQVEDIVRLGFIDSILQRDKVAEIAIYKKKLVLFIRPVQQMRHIIQRTAPAAHAEYIPIGIGQ